MDILLLFLVSENLEECEWEKISKLLHAVYRYQIEELIKKCISFLETHLSATNVCDVLVLAETYKNTELKMIAQEYISSHASEVFSSDAWTKFMIQNPESAAEMLHYFSSVCP
ncbi:protein roadkill [Caerostris extrusa]|uniref:Protein roadkill n=1 Tax=Caerostris extrusa TaxID=172846 RepID=A0AAV4UIT5_CAEEX|nr:protein roadkill [Caerostris extrusa]